MKKTKILNLAALSIFCLNGYAQTEKLSESFPKGVPSTFKTFSQDGMNINAKLFASTITPANVWYGCDAKGIPDENFDFSEGSYETETGTFTHGRMGLLSCSHRSDANKATSSWLVTPQIKVTEGASIRWMAKSIHYDLREDYKVMISTTDDKPESFKEIASIENEGYLWQYHFVDLTEYVGQNVYIAFVHCSTNKFILALDELEIGVPAKTNLRAVNTGLHYFDSTDTPAVNVAVTNYGAEGNVKSYSVRLADKTVIGEFAPENGALKSGENVEMEIPLTLNVGEAGFYDVVAVLEDGSEQVILHDFANRSQYRRKMFVEKYTGTWCNSCPKVMYTAHIACERLGQEAIYAEVHHPGTGGDKDGNMTYISGVPSKVRADYPALWYNRTHMANTYKVKDVTPYEKAVLTPTIAKATVSGTINNATDIKATATVQFAEDLDNSDDRYRVGFIVMDESVAPHPQSGAQAWQVPAGGPYYGEAHYYPTSIDKEFNTLHHIVRGSADGGCGISGSLPKKIEAGKEYTVEFAWQCDESVRGDEQLIVANIVDSKTSTMEILNSDMAVLGRTSGINNVWSGNDNIRVITTAKGIVVSFNECKYDVTVYTPAGTLIGQASGFGENAEIPVGDFSGVLVVNVKSGEESTSLKVVR